MRCPVFVLWVGAGVASGVCCLTHSNWNNPTPQSSDETGWIAGGTPHAPHMGPRRDILEGPCWGSSVPALSMYVRYFSVFAVCAGHVLHFGELATYTWVSVAVACMIKLGFCEVWVDGCKRANIIPKYGPWGFIGNGTSSVVCPFIMYIYLGRSERSASISEDVITTAVCPRYYILQIKAKNNFLSSRSRPEGKRISPPPGLQPPPSLPPRKMGDRQTAQVPLLPFLLTIRTGRLSEFHACTFTGPYFLCFTLASC